MPLAMQAVDLSDIDLCAFDMDGTLYKYSPDYLAVLHIAQSTVVMNMSQGRLTMEAARAMCSESYQTLGSGWTLPAQFLGISDRDIHVAYHESINTDLIEPLPMLRESFCDAAQNGLALGIITHSHMHFCDRVLQKLTIRDALPDNHIVTLEQVDYREKQNDKAMFEEICMRSGIAPERMLVIEDSIKNLFLAKAMGAKTAYVNWGTPLETLPGHVDIQLESPIDANQQVIAARKARLAPNPQAVLI